MRRRTLGTTLLLALRSRAASTADGASSERAHLADEPTATTPPPPQPAARNGQAAKMHPQLSRLVTKELLDEAAGTAATPPKPQQPKGWLFDHVPGAGFFTLRRAWRNRHAPKAAPEEVLLRVWLERPGHKTFRPDGERAEPEHFNFSVFLRKPSLKPEEYGGLEFAMTVVDGEVVMDALTVHSTAADFNQAVDAPLAKRATLARDAKYRGPYTNELDEDFADELMNFLDDRGIHNAFGDYLVAQAHWTEHQEYLAWLAGMRSWASLPHETIWRRGVPPMEAPPAPCAPSAGPLAPTPFTAPTREA